MEISTLKDTITIAGNIKSVSDFQNIKNSVDSVVEYHKSITIIIKDSISITSSVIGYLNKLVLKDKIEMQIQVGDQELATLFEDLNLKSLFNVSKI